VLGDAFELRSYADLNGWEEDDHLSAFDAFQRSALYAADKRYKDGGLGVSFQDLKPAFAASLAANITDRPGARQFFEHWFIPALVKPEPGKQGHVTGFYEPVVKASRKQTAAFPVPLYRRPDDLVEINDSTRPAAMDPYFRFARKTGTGLEEYPDRGDIERGALAGRGLEFVWLTDSIESFFIHVQGAARLQFANGTETRVTYSGKSGHPFTGPGRVLIDKGEIDPKTVSMQSIRSWLKANPERVDDILWHNRSFIFFEEGPVGDPELGPVAAAKVQLTAGRSMAVDRLMHVFGSPFFIDAPKADGGDGKPFHRLMIAQDTGSAITGAARGDLFTGSGFDAGQIAGRINAAADFYLLVPRKLAGVQR
jgi:membrane-bound lytic murein transglycosylase A